MDLFNNLNLAEGFRKYFDLIPVTTEALRHDVYRIRHEVYCEDLRFEPAQPSQLETDAYDAHSVHCLLRTTGPNPQWVGCVRLVLPRPNTPAALLPFERICAQTLDRAIVDPARLPRTRIAEVSRLAIRLAFRRRHSDARMPLSITPEDFGIEQRPRFPYAQIGLYLGAIALARHHGIETLFVLTEPRLAAYFSRLGVDTRQIGSPVEHSGIRVPSMMKVQDIIEHLNIHLRPLWQVVDDTISRGFSQATPDNRFS
jgi:N-acyl amino acid synthase of PEP-CTERM/exosortase system